MTVKTGYPSLDRNHEDHFKKEIIEKELPKGINIYDYILQSNKNRLNLPAINYFDNRITYREFLDNSTKVAMALAHYGVKKGDYITAILPNTPEAFYLLLGASRLGAIVSFVDPRYGEKAIEQKINITNSKVVIALDGVVKTYNRRSNTFNEKHVIDKVASIIDNTNAEVLIGLSAGNSLTLKSILKNDVIRANLFKQQKSNYKDYYSWKEFFKNSSYSRDLVFPKYEDNTPIAVVSTSGSTGTPKNALFSNENIIQATAQVKNIGVFPEEGRWYDIMPPSIIYGLADGSVLGFSLGNELRLNPDPTAMSLKTPNQLQMVEDFVRFDPHTITCAPNHVFAILNSKEWRNKPHSLVSFGVGGDSLNANQVERANKILEGLKRPKDFDKKRFFGDDEDRVVLNFGYGSTEVTGACSVAPSNKKVRLGTVGLTLPYQVVSAFKKNENTGEYEELPYVLNSELDNVPAEKQGEICVQGPNIMQGYLFNEEETAKTIVTHKDRKKWVHMGDYGFVDEDGYVHFVNREKYIGVGHDGFKVAPLEIEEVILKEPRIDDCKAVIFDDLEENRGSVIKVYYTLLEKDKPCDIKELEDKLNLMCQMELADYKCPVDYECIERLPLNNSGKVDIPLLKADAEEKSKVKILRK